MAESKYECREILLLYVEPADVVELAIEVRRGFWEAYPQLVAVSRVWSLGDKSVVNEELNRVIGYQDHLCERMQGQTSELLLAP